MLAFQYGLYMYRLISIVQFEFAYVNTCACFCQVQLTKTNHTDPENYAIVCFPGYQ